MKKRLLAGLLTLAMLLTMAPVAFAVEDTEDTVDADQVPAAEEAVVKQNQIATQSDSALQQTINNAADGSTVTMSESEQADITINKNITLDLNGKTLKNTNAGKATISVTDGATVTVKNGTVIGGASYYNIQVGTAVNSTANLTLESVTATAGNSGSSMIDNWGTLTVNSGAYTGGLDVVKSEEGSTLTINGGTFSFQGSGNFSGAILSYGKTVINDGEFIQSKTTRVASYPFVVGVMDGYTSYAEIKGGSFTNNSSLTTAGCIWALGKANATNLKIFGGKFNKASSTFSNYIAEGYAFDTKAKEIKTAVTTVTLNKTELTLRGGESETLVATPGPESAEIQTVTWSSSDKKIATVSTSGKITALMDGTVTITAKPAGSNKVATCTVKIDKGAAMYVGGSRQYATLEDAVKMASNGKTIQLLDNIDLTSTIVISKKLTLDMNGYTISNTTDLWDSAPNAWSLISVRENGDLTITGNGTMKAKENDCYALDTQDETAKLTIENGTFVGNISAIYINPGEVNIKGGSYSIQQLNPNNVQDGYGLTINCYDSAYRDGTAKVSISGGTFNKFNPANNAAEGKGTNFLETGYVTKKVGDNYVVKANDNQTIADLDKAIEVIKDNNSKDADVKTAVSVIENIDNADLASNSAAMSKLAGLDNELTTGENPAVTVEATTDEETGIDADKVTVTNAALSADLTSNTEQKVVVTIADGSATIDEADVTAAKNAAGITDDVAVQKLNISMTVNGEKVEKPTAPVVLEFSLPTDWKGCQIVCVDDVNNPEVIPTTVIGNTVKATFNHFSDYALLSSTKVANPNKYQIVLTPQNGETTVYPGDNITFDVVLKRTEGNSDIVHRVQFTPTSDMLTVTGGTAETNFTYNTTSKQFTHLDASNPVTLTNGEVKVGSITCTVNNNGTRRGNLEVAVGDQDTVTVSGYQNSNGLEVAEIPVEYAVIQVYFTNYTGKLDSKGNEETELKTFYTSLNNKELYASLDDLATHTSTNVPTANDGSIADGTQYRLVDDVDGHNLNNWVAADGTTKYVDIVADSGAGFTDKMSFYVSRVKLLEVDKPDGVDIDTSIKTTTRDGKTYVDYNKDFTFTVPDAGAGMKNEVTVTVNGTTVTVTPDPDIDNKYTVNNDEMIASPVKITVTPMIDLDVDDIGVFDDGLGKFLQYSKYSGEDTLVLIKGDIRVKYTLSSNTGVEVPEIYALPANHGYGDYTLAVLIPRPTLPDGANAREIMLNYLKNTYNIAVGEGTNTAIDKYNFDTNGDGNGKGTFKLDDAQATYDFSALEKAAMYWEPSDVELLKADVLTYDNDRGEHNIPRDGQVTTEDVDAFLYNYVYPGMHP